MLAQLETGESYIHGNIKLKQGKHSVPKNGNYSTNVRFTVNSRYCCQLLDMVFIKWTVNLTRCFSNWTASTWWKLFTACEKNAVISFLSNVIMGQHMTTAIETDPICYTILTSFMIQEVIQWVLMNWKSIKNKSLWIHNTAWQVKIDLKLIIVWIKTFKISYIYILNNRDL